ncbi:MAG: neutral/alkaline non-lysosomal ceramidase N-terminal domain-containing protein [Verrucomicrobiota bacterium]
MKVRAAVVILLVSSASLLAQKGVEPMQWKAGAAVVSLIPKGPMYMEGYAARTEPAEGQASGLFAKALAVEDKSGNRVVMITTDLISVPRPVRDWLEAEVAKKYQLPAQSLLINCSHTHCGPELRTTQSGLMGKAPERQKLAVAYVTKLQQDLLILVGDALADLAPAQLSYCHARAAFAMNRRTPTDTGFKNFPNPDGPVDHDVPVLKVEQAGGKLKAVLFGYACHNTTLGFQKFCGDYAGFAQQYLQEANPDTLALFMMGCGGDQNPYPRRTLDLAQQHGRTLANAVESALDTQARPLSGPLRAAYETVTVDYAKAPSKEQVIALTQSKNKYDKAWGERLMVELKDKGKLREHYDAPIQVLQFGTGLTLIALPGETMVDYSLRLKRELKNGEAGASAVWVAGYSNDVWAYLPSLRVLKEGGYEGGDSMKYFTTTVQPGPFSDTIEKRIVGKVHELIEQVKVAKNKQGAQ